LVNFIDYGNNYRVAYADVWKISPEVAEIPIISRSVIIKLKSGKNISSIDVDASIDKMCESEIFEGSVELIGKKCYCTVDDSVFAFKY
jgi:hypothetical protein